MTQGYWLVVPAAGAGRRFAGADHSSSTPKQYAPLVAATVIEHALAPFLGDDRCRGAVVAIGVDDARWPAIEQRCRARYGVPLRSVTGGAERAHSVRLALTALSGEAAPDDWVLVHDAVRPCVSRAEIDALLDSSGGLLALPLADTLKRAAPATPDGAVAVEGTEPRARLWRALTPQMFRVGVLGAALDAARAAGREPTDEAQAIEWQGGSPRLVGGDPTNLKITTAADLALAEAILRARMNA